MKRILHRIHATGIWAPAVVLVFHEFVSIRGWRTEIDWLNHYSGGLSFTFFTWKSLPFLHRIVGNITCGGRVAAAFLAGCTAALMWEIGEFTSDIVLHTHIQKSIDETMMDLVNGFLGTVTIVCILTFLEIRRIRSKSHSAGVTASGSRR